MSISIVQSQASDITTSGTSIAATLPVGTAANNLIVANVVWHGNSGTISPPAGWTQAWTSSNSNVQVHSQFYFLDTSGGNTSFTFTFSGSADGACATLYELHATNGWATTPFDQSATNGSAASQTTETTGTTAATTAASEIAIAGFSNGSDTSSGNWSSPTNGYTQDLFISETTATSWVALQTSYKILTATSAGESTGFTVSAGAKWVAGVGTYAEAAGGGATHNQTLVDTQSATDSRFNTVNKPNSDFQSGTDSRYSAVGMTESDTQSATDSRFSVVSRLQLDTQSATDALSHLWNAYRALSEALSGLDGVQKALQKSLLDQFSGIDLVNTSNQVFTGTSWRQNLTDSFSEQDFLVSWTLMKALSDAYSGIDSQFSQVGSALYDVISGNDQLAKQIERAIAETVSAVDKVTAGKVLLLRLLDTASLLDTPMVAYTKSQFGLLSLLTSLVASTLGMSVSFASTNTLGTVVTLLPSSLEMVIQLLSPTSGLSASITLLPAILAMTISLLY